MSRPAPAFTEAIDWAHASIRASGRLTVQGADLIRGAAEVLRRSGHRRITVDLHEVALVDTDALGLLRVLADDLAAQHGWLVVLTQQEVQP
jgi:anti-anti-sigma regulatory factor